MENYKVTITVTDGKNTKSFDFLPDSQNFEEAFYEVYGYVIY